MAEQLAFDYSKKQFVKGRTKDMAQRIITSTTKRINQEEDPDRKYKLKIIKTEFSKLIDQL